MKALLLLPALLLAHSVMAAEYGVELDESAMESATIETNVSLPSEQVFNAFSGVIDADMVVTGSTISGSAIVKADGSIVIDISGRIDTISVNDIRVSGSDTGASFGTINITGVEFGAGSFMTVRPSSF